MAGKHESPSCPKLLSMDLSTDQLQAWQDRSKQTQKGSSGIEGMCWICKLTCVTPVIRQRLGRRHFARASAEDGIRAEGHRVKHPCCSQEGLDGLWIALVISLHVMPQRMDESIPLMGWHILGYHIHFISYSQ